MDFSAPARQAIRKPVKPNPSIVRVSSSSSGGGSQSQNGRPSSSSTPRSIPAPSPSHKRPLPSSAASSSSRPIGTSLSPGVKRKPGPSSHSSGTGRAGPSVASSRSSTPAKRRRSFSPIQSESSSSESDSDGRSDTGISKSSKGVKGTASNKGANGHGNGVNNGSGKSRGDRSSRSASTKPANGVNGLEGHVKVPYFKQGRDLWCLDKVDARGEWDRGWAGFTNSEEALRGHVLGWNGGKGPGKGTAVSKYVAYFPQEGFQAPVSESDPLPMVEILYPAKGCKEKFVLLVPQEGTIEYNPVAELKGVMTMILDPHCYQFSSGALPEKQADRVDYIPPSHRALFGTLSTSLGTDIDRPKAGPAPGAAFAPSPLPLSTSTPVPAPFSSPQHAANGNSITTTDTNVSGHFAQSAPTPVPSAPSTPMPIAADPFAAAAASAEEGSSASASSQAAAVESVSIGTALRRALAPNRRDGPGLVAAIERYNVAMLALQESGEMEAWMKEHAKELGDAQWSALCERINEMAYARVVGPYSNELEHHPKHPEDVAKVISGKEDSYGELRHNFMSSIIALTNLCPSSVFVDLGSGVGNCILQTALQAGCESYGVELLPVPSHCARLQLQEAKRRWAMWGINGNTEVKVEEGDMRGNARVAGWLRRADVVLVNNEVFSPNLNEDLKNMFLDLRDGAKIVSLKPFVNEGFKMNESNCDSFDAIVKLSKHNYYHSWVSWKGDMGEFYVQEIDRRPRIKFEEDLAKGRGSRSTRR